MLTLELAITHRINPSIRPRELHFMKINITLLSEKRTRKFIGAGEFIMINTVNLQIRRVDSGRESYVVFVRLIDKASTV